MADLSTSWLGLPMRNPLMVAASGLTANVDAARKAALAGAGAIVLKSLFEEQLSAELEGARAALEAGAHPEAEAFFRRAGMTEGEEDYLRLIEGCLGNGIPVIASVNCVGRSRWAEFASRIESAGADALELNMAMLPRSKADSGADMETRLVEVVSSVRAASRLPLAVKLGQGYASLPNLTSHLVDAGAGGLVLFNRFYRLDVDLEKLALKSGPSRSTGDEYHESLRWISLLAGRYPVDFAAATGVHEAETALKLVAAGARAVQVCSVIYRRGLGVIGEMARAMGDWMEGHGLPSIDGLRGRLSQAESQDPVSHERLQYIKALTGIG